MRTLRAWGQHVIAAGLALAAAYTVFAIIAACTPPLPEPEITVFPPLDASAETATRER
jgi:hypothetical protein